MAETKAKATAKKRPSQSSGGGKKKLPSTRHERVEKKKTRRAEVKGIVLIALGVFLVISLFFDVTGIVGHWFKSFVLGIFGGPAYIFFIFVIWAGIELFVEKKNDKASYKIWLLFALMVSTSVLWAAICGGSEWNYKTFLEAINSMYGYGAGGGGVIGGLLCAGLSKLIGLVGTVILSVAAILVLLVIVTEVSVEKLFLGVSSFLKKNKAEISENLDEEIELDTVGSREKTGKPDKKKVKIRRKKNANEKAEEEPSVQGKADDVKEPGRSASNKAYFDAYFRDSKKEAFEHTEPRKRFVFEDAFPEEEPAKAEKETAGETAEIAAEDRKEKAISRDRGGRGVVVPDSIAVNTGVLTGLPDENGKFRTGDEEFTPPTEAQIEDRLDPLTQAALDAGAALDSAVVVGKRMSQQEVQQAANSVNAMAKESIEATKLLNYKLPSVSLLAKPKPKTKSRAEEKREIEEKANRLLETLASFKVEANVINVTQGPTVTRFELQPGFGVKVSKITNLADDIALSLAASGVRIEAPIPGKSAIGIEIPNATPSPVPIREVIDTDKFRDFKSKTAFALGKDISGNCVVADIASFPHILIAGATGSGKSVCINSLITSILYKAKPNEVKMIMVDPKMVELGVYNGIPHLLIPVVTDPKHAAGALNWAVAEMKNRYQLMKDNKVRNLQGFNELMEEEGTPENKLPEIVIIIDELADLMLAAKSEVEDAINSLAALARAAGMYLVIATQRPSVDVITGVIKANVPSRISFAVSSQVDSRTILDSMGAEKLLGKGDMLYAPRGAVKPMRIQGNFLSDEEIETIIDFVKNQYEVEYDESILEHIEREQENGAEDTEDDDDHTRSGEKDALFVKAAELVFESGQASVAMLQRRYKIGYQRAARIIDQLEENRIIGPYEGTKPRQVLITRAELNEMLMNNPD
ncbi:MAG: DNA translocase FtsK [Ruminococcaceae bacterium]|nr:DNA translocase FtsK [Oscillospiraceae bacterium]